ncbi:MAG: tRNA guanosine(34) transglycosylase Tgt [Dehalococcoidales bacterium]|nr:tRNA guanosine(34) transglycosylase Tgt [Dehalococcoidales bacterium]
MLLSLRKEIAITDYNWFRLKKTSADSRARLGELVTPHGEVSTPVFMPVGSQATVKTLTPRVLAETGHAMILANTYHLYLRPGIDIVEKLGGLHRFMDWDGAILTDSGGFQIFSLSRLRRINEEGVKFRSHIDGSEHFITPEMDIRYQEALGADVIMALDICPSFEEKKESVREATDRTHRWAERCLKAQQRRDQALFAIVQGGFSEELRRESVRSLTSMDFPGYALGGLSLGEPKELTRSMIDIAIPLLPEARPRYLMGVGSPEDILFAVEKGTDMFDSVLPTRVARNGGLFTSAGRVNIRNSAWKECSAPVDPACGCYTCRRFSAAYLHHLFRAGELLAYTLATIHNLTFMHGFMERVRKAIGAGDFKSFKDDFLTGYQTTEETVRLAQKQKWREKWEGA